MNCPICAVQLKAAICPSCGREWFETGNPEAPLQSKRRKVRLTKMPEAGDRVNDVIRPVDPPSGGAA